jgi:hypothetical protein
MLHRPQVAPQSQSPLLCACQTPSGNGFCLFIVSYYGLHLEYDGGARTRTICSKNYTWHFLPTAGLLHPVLEGHLVGEEVLTEKEILV